MRVLAERHEVYLFALSDQKVLKEWKQAMYPICKSIVFQNISKPDILKGFGWAMLHKKPLQAGYFRSAKALGAVKSYAEAIQPDVVFCQLVRTAEYIDGLPGFKVLDYQDALSVNMQRRAAASSFPANMVFSRESKRLKKYEAALFGDFDLKLIISEPDRDAIDHPQKEDILTVPNGVDFEYFTPDYSAEKKYDILFTGNMSYAPNIEGAIWLVREIMPRIRAHRPDTSLLIAGASPVRAVQQLAGDGIIVSGWMDDIREAYSCSRLFLAPMCSGSGLQNKLLEAMSMQLPCITTSLANSSLRAQPEQHILVGNTAEEIAQLAVRLLHDSDTANRIAQDGHRWVKEQYDWETHITDFEHHLLKKYDTWKE